MTKPLDFEKVDTLRRNMLLTTTQISELFGVTRQTYFNYVDGRSTPGRDRLEKIRKVVRRLLFLVVDKGWPQGDVIGAPSAYRYDLLKAELAALRDQD